MKRILCLLSVFLLALGLYACSGGYGQININETIAIPEDGIIKKSVFEKTQKSNSISVFSGVSGDMTYEWTVFGSDITESKDTMMSLSLSREGNGVRVDFDGIDVPGFPALLSIHLNEKWNATSAVAYYEGAPVYSVSLTGSKNTILNIPITKTVESCVIIPDIQEDNKSETQAPVPFETTAPSHILPKEDDYLSLSKSEDGKLYTDTEELSSENQMSHGNSQALQNDSYLSGTQNSPSRDESETDQDDSFSEPQSRPNSDGSATDKDKYLTDPVPEGKPLPVEPENQEINKEKTYTCTFSIECSTILNNLSDLDPDKLELVPSNGVILAPTTVTFYEGESVFDVLQRVCKENNIHLEFSWTPIYNSAYIEGIHNLYEFDCGALSGWMYRVDGWYPNYGCSRYQLADGEVVEWRYTCDLGEDVGRDGSW